MLKNRFPRERFLTRTNLVKLSPKEKATPIKSIKQQELPEEKRLRARSMKKRVRAPMKNNQARKAKKRRIQKGGNWGQNEDQSLYGDSAWCSWFRPRCVEKIPKQRSIHSKVKREVKKRDAVTKDIPWRTTPSRHQQELVHPWQVLETRPLPNHQFGGNRSCEVTIIWPTPVHWIHCCLHHSLVISFFRCGAMAYLLAKKSFNILHFFFQLMWAFWIYWSTFFFIAKQQH